ncbi:MAG TPA: protocatechuate 3,4-dioxygenase subunit alpha [Terriglobales bacterium]|jgi:protocatechuate 3,4-dioxygenase alpha subunit
MDLVPTPSQTVGPFFYFGLTTKERCIPCIAGPGIKGERVFLTCRVLDGDNEPLNDAMVEIWQADAQGKYNHPDDPQSTAVQAGWRGFGRMGTNEEGKCEFETIKPGRVPGPGNVSQAPHLLLAVFARGMMKQMYTRIYFDGDPANAQDPVLALVPPERRNTLLATSDPARAGGWKFDLRLQGEGETVFFDV